MIRSELLGILKQLEGRSVLVVGDVMLDEHVWSKVSRISPEAPIPVAEVVSSTYVPGGAANAASNIKSMGGEPYLVGIIGKDSSGKTLVNELMARGINVEGLIPDRSRPTTLKTRIIAHDQQLVRVDREIRKPIEGKTLEKVMQAMQEGLKETKVAVISDYAKGVITPELCRELISTARDTGKIVIVDPKGTDYSKYKGATIISPNQSEAELATRLKITNEQSLLEAGKRLLEDVSTGWVIITRGRGGMSLFGKDGEVTHIPALETEVYDIAGAGDTAVGTLALALAAGVEVKKAAMLANWAAGLVVKKVGIATVTREELEQALNDSGNNDAKRKIKSLDELKRIREQLKEKGMKVVSTNGCFDILHLGHVRYLEEAKHFGDVLIVMINSDESMKRIKGDKRPLVPQEERAEIVAALECVDYVTIFSESTPEVAIKILKPDVHVKGGDYQPEDLPETKVAKSYGGKVVVVDEVKGKSTTNIIDLILGRFAS